MATVDYTNPLAGPLRDVIGEIDMGTYAFPVVRVSEALLSRGIRKRVKAYAIIAFLAPPNGKRIPAEYMIDKAIATGILKQGGILVEPTSGGMGGAMAMCAKWKYGVSFYAIVSDKMQNGKIQPQINLGAIIKRESEVLQELGLERSPGTMQLAQMYADHLGGVFLNQYHNPWNPESWETQVAPQIHAMFGGKITEAFFGLGSTGTMRGLGGGLKKLVPTMKIIATYPYFMSEIAGLRGPERLAEVAEWKHVPDFHEPINERTAKAYSSELFAIGGIAGGESSGAVFGECDNYYSNLGERGELGDEHIAIMPFMDTFLPYPKFA